MFKIIRIMKFYNIDLFTVATCFTLFHLEFYRRIIDGIRANMNYKHAVIHGNVFKALLSGIRRKIRAAFCLRQN